MENSSWHAKQSENHVTRLWQLYDHGKPLDYSCNVPESEALDWLLKEHERGNRYVMAFDADYRGLYLTEDGHFVFE